MCVGSAAAAASVAVAISLHLFCSYQNQFFFLNSLSISMARSWHFSIVTFSFVSLLGYVSIVVLPVCGREGRWGTEVGQDDLITCSAFAVCMFRWDINWD